MTGAPEQAGMTLAGLLRGHTANIYFHPKGVLTTEDEIALASGTEDAGQGISFGKNTVRDQPRHEPAA